MQNRFLHYDVGSFNGMPVQEHDFTPVVNHINQGKKAFIIVYMTGCPPCNATLPEWDKIKTQGRIPEDTMVMKVNRELKDDLAKELQMEELRNVSSFPTITMIEKDKPMSHYQGERTANDFTNWIETNSKSTQTTPLTQESSTEEMQTSPKQKITKRKRAASIPKKRQATKRKRQPQRGSQKKKRKT
jgi:hypothetical protein